MKRHFFSHQKLFNSKEYLNFYESYYKLLKIEIEKLTSNFSLPKPV